MEWFSGKAEEENLFQWYWEMGDTGGKVGTSHGERDSVFSSGFMLSPLALTSFTWSANL